MSILTCRSEVLCRIHVLDYAGYTAPTRQHELAHTDHTDRTDQGHIRHAWQI